MRALTGVVVAFALLGGAACLEPGRPVLATLDNDPPELISSDPPPGGTFDKAGFIFLTFSERMDERSLRPGIWLFEGKERVPVLVQIPPDNGLGVPEASEQSDVAYTVKVGGESPLKANTKYLLVLDRVLTDSEGNMLAVPQTDAGVADRLELLFTSSP